MPTRRVLVVHDDADARRIYRAALEFAGFEVVEALDARDIRAATEATVPSAVICDLYVRAVADESVVARLRRDPRLTGTPVLVLSAWSSAAHRELALQLGVESFMHMPVSPARLVEEVRRVVGLPASPGPSLEIRGH
jgi:DNA-binding response OmpR family regulator